MKKLWEENRPLTITGCLMFVAFLLSLAGLVLDPRVITGAPAWLKPAKFGISTAIYAFTIAWIFTWIPGQARLKMLVGWITSIVLVLEVAIIDLQAARGVTSHFNNHTPFDAALFGIMGIAILIAWGASIALTVALFRTRFDDRAMGWALRLGLLITVFGAAVGGVMVTPTKPQLAEARAGHPLTTTGAHTVGGPDGGPGMIGTGWSREHGDLRVSHFFGLHAMQILPILTWLFFRRRPGWVIAAGSVYGAVLIFLFAQAMAGQPFLGGIL